EVERGDVGELEHGDLVEVALELGEELVGDAAVVVDEAVGVGEHGPFGGGVPGAYLAELTQLGVEAAVGRLVEPEPLDAVVEDVGTVGEHGPPVARGAIPAAGLRDGVTALEAPLVHGRDDGGSGFVFGNLSEAGHGGGGVGGGGRVGRIRPGS